MSTTKIYVAHHDNYSGEKKRYYAENKRDSVQNIV